MDKSHKKTSVFKKQFAFWKRGNPHKEKNTFTGCVESQVPAKKRKTPPSHELESASC